MKCDHCEQERPVVTQYGAGGYEGVICPQCLADHEGDFPICPDCGTRYHSGNCPPSGCPRCAEDLVSCSNCTSQYHADDLHTVVGREGDFCNDCIGDLQLTPQQ